MDSTSIAYLMCIQIIYIHKLDMYMYSISHSSECTCHGDLEQGCRIWATLVRNHSPGGISAAVSASHIPVQTETFSHRERTHAHHEVSQTTSELYVSSRDDYQLKEGCHCHEHVRFHWPLVPRVWVCQYSTYSPRLASSDMQECLGQEQRCRPYCERRQRVGGRHQESDRMGQSRW